MKHSGSNATVFSKPISSVDASLYQKFFRKIFIRWLSKREKKSDRYTLHRNNLYIFPSVTGCAFLLLSVVIWLLGTNYQNNLILALAYMQISLFVVIILNTYNNLAGLEIIAGHAQSACVGEQIDFNFSVRSANRIGTHYVAMAWLDSRYSHLFDFKPDESNKIHISVVAKQRGYLSPKYLRVESTFPMGLLRCGTWLGFDVQALVYPKPIACDLPPNTEGQEGESTGLHLRKGDDFAGFTPYQPGDSPKHLAWTLYARGQGLHRKQYGEPQSIERYLNWSDFYQGNVERCLSNLCYWALKLNRENLAFGLSLPDSEISVGEGDAHLQTVLVVLALFQSGK